MPLITVVTAAYAEEKCGAHYLLQTWDSLTGQRMPRGWEWEWVVQEDGEASILGHVLPSNDERIRYGHSGIRRGPGSCRNLALGRARGELVRNVDADDTLLDDGLATTIELLTSHPDAAWCVSERIEFDDDPADGFGAVTQEPDDIPVTRVIPRGAIARDLASTGRFGVHCSSLAARIGHLRAMGGWVGLPRSEDTILVGALNVLYPGVYTTRPTFRYRRHRGQLSTEPWSLSLIPEARRIFWQRVEALSSLRLVGGPCANSGDDLLALASEMLTGERYASTTPTERVPS